MEEVIINITDNDEVVSITIIDGFSNAEVLGKVLTDLEAHPSRELPTALDTIFTFCKKTLKYLTDLKSTAFAESHFKGVYTSIESLTAAVPDAIPGDYAQVDEGEGTDVKNYNWDEDEGWVLGGGGPSTISGTPGNFVKIGEDNMPADSGSKASDFEPALGFTPENAANKNQNNGYCPLDSGGKVPAANLPATLMSLEGEWDASRNNPELQDGMAGYDAGAVFECTTAGTVNFGHGNITFKVGDWAVYGANNIWYKSVNSNEVTSVNGQTGTVVLDADDISDSATTKKFTNDTEKGTWNGKAEGNHNHSGIYSDFNITINTSTDSYVLALTDANTLRRMNKSTANNLTIPLNSSVPFPIGTRILTESIGVGQTTIVATGGVTINSCGNRLKIAAQFCGALLLKTDTDTWWLSGDLIL